MSSGPLEHHLPIPLFPLCRQYVYTIRDDRRGLFAALVYFLRFLRFLRSTLSLKTSDWWGRWLDQVKDAPAQSKSSNKFPSLCSTQPHIRGSSTNPSLLLWRGQPVCRGPVSDQQSLRTECTYSRTTRSCARSVRSATRRQLSVPQLALRAYPDDRLEDRGGTRPRFVERGSPTKLSSPSQSLYMDMAMVIMQKKGGPERRRDEREHGEHKRDKALRCSRLVRPLGDRR